MRPYSAAAIREWERAISGEGERIIVGNQRMVLLIGCDNSSLVIDKLCDEAGEGDTAVMCFYFDFASRNEQSPVNMLGSLLRQFVSGLGGICSKCERQGHNLFYLDNTAQVRSVLRGTLSEEEGRADLVGVLVLNYSKTGGR